MQYGDVVLYREAGDDAKVVHALVVRSAMLVPHVSGVPVKDAAAEEILDLLYLDPDGVGHKYAGADHLVKTVFGVRPRNSQSESGWAVTPQDKLEHDFKVIEDLYRQELEENHKLPSAEDLDKQAAELKATEATLAGAIEQTEDKASQQASEPDGQQNQTGETHTESSGE